MSLIEKAIDVLRRYQLCDHCLGRLFARVGFGLSNNERGASIKNVIHMLLYSKLVRCEDERCRESVIQDLIKLAESGHEPTMRLLGKLNVEVKSKPCYICNNVIFENLHSLVSKAVDYIRSSWITFRRFSVGTRIPNEILQRELELSVAFNIDSSESIKREINRIVGKEIENAIGHVIHDRDNPDVLIVVNPVTQEVSVELKPIYIYTRYRKLVRNVSQAQLKLNVLTSIRREISALAKLFECSDIVIHASGREDVDVRMLGSGRPMVIAVIGPRRRPDVSEIRDALRRASSELVQFDHVDAKLTARSSVRRLKRIAERDVKLYRVLAYLQRDVEEEKILSLEQYFRNRQIVQCTPRRIKRRPASKRKVKMVYELRALKLLPRVIEMIVKCQGGLYVKELVTGDEGRTQPSVSEVLGVEVVPVEVDVLDVLEVPE